MLSQLGMLHLISVSKPDKPDTVLFLLSIMNLFGVLKYKKMGEDFVRDSGIPFTIIRSVLLVSWLFTYLRRGQFRSLTFPSVLGLGD